MVSLDLFQTIPQNRDVFLTAYDTSLTSDDGYQIKYVGIMSKGFNNFLMGRLMSLSHGKQG